MTEIIIKRRKKKGRHYCILELSWKLKAAEIAYINLSFLIYFIAYLVIH